MQKLIDFLQLIQKISEPIKRLSDPLTRTLWRIALFKAHRYSTVKLWFHCLFNVHQFGTIFNSKQDKTIFMTQHFCATCYPDILPKIVEALKKQQEQIQKPVSQ